MSISVDYEARKKNTGKKKFFIVFDDTDGGGYSLGNVCDLCVPKAISNATLMGQYLTIDEITNKEGTVRCSYCSIEKTN